MVLCTYFLNNNCRYGSKCNNEHYDIITVIKGEIDVAIKGSQWPLSCFGPFKERNSVPNFIEDLSFEEIRMMYLEAKSQNNIPAHQMQLAQMITDGKNKMQWLGTFNRGILNMLVELYNQQDPNTGTKLTNPFASAASVGNTSAAASIFGGGNSTGSTGHNAFGANANNNSGGNIFGNSAPQVQTNANIFGSSAAAGGNLFDKTATGGGNNIFGMAAASLGPSQPTPANMFGGPPVFSGGPATANMFGSTIQQQPSQPTGASMFGSTVTDGASGGNIFAQAAFGQQTASQAQNPFAAAAAPIGSPFAIGTTNNTNNAINSTGVSNMFGNGGSAAFGQPGTMAPPTQPSTGLFSSAFGSSNTTVSPFAQPTTTTSQSIFVPTPQPQTVAPVTSSAFGNNANPFGAQAASVPQQHQSNVLTPQAEAQFYSKLESLTKEQLDAFGAERFEMGKIPTVPPPKELCQ